MDGPAHRPLKLAHTTRTGSGCRSTPFAVAVGDDALATIEGGCGSESRVVLRDYARGGHARVIAHTRRIKALAAAGRYVAWVQTTGRPNGHWAYSIVVYDHARNRVAYRVSNGGRADHLSVQADGKVAGQSANGPIVTAWYSAANRTRHEAPGGSVMPPRLGADRLLFRGSLDPGPTSLVLRDIGSWAPRVVASFPSGQFRPDSVRPNFDFDGRRVAYIQTGATGNELWLVDA